MFDFQSYFQHSLDQLREEGLYRYFLNVNKSARHFPHFYYEKNGETKRAINFCSNDYLGMSVEEEVIGKLSYILHHSGTGSSGTRNISGTTQQHQSLEKSLAAWHRKESALLFGGAYLANVTALQTIGRKIPDLVFISDERNHASIIEGMRAAGNEKKIFRHNDVLHLSEILASLPADLPKMVVFESVYSMNGSVAPVKEIIQISKKFNALTYIDEVHAIGLYGETGAGILEKEGWQHEVDLINGTLAKAVGVYGGYIAGNELIIDFIRSFGSGFIFTTSLPPAICAAAEKSVELIRSYSDRRQNIKELVTYLRGLLDEFAIPYTCNDSHITPVLIQDASRCKIIADRLLDGFGVYVQPVNYPTVPVGEECLRLIITAKHNSEQIFHLVQSLKKVFLEEAAHHMPKEPTQSVAG
jgi:5-aminolevulinate synthase